jgi:hypothetical protein
MRFREPKLNISAISSLERFAAKAIVPYTLMPAPVYVLLQQNQKLVAVKSPLDFFSAKDFERLHAITVFYMPRTVDATLPFTQAGQKIKMLLEWTPTKRSGESKFAKPVLPKVPYELSNEILKIIGPLWGGKMRIEPFFVSLLVQAVCGLLPAEMLSGVRDKSVEVFEKAVLHSSWAVFLALHLGHCDLGFLNRLRLETFSVYLEDEKAKHHGPIVRELIEQGTELLASGVKGIEADTFATKENHIMQKMASRLGRIRDELVRPEHLCASVFGEGGFADA